MHRNNNNGLKTVLLLGALGAVFLLGGEAIAGRQGLLFGLGFAVFVNFLSYWFSDKLALAMTGARPLTPEKYPEVYQSIAPMVERLCVHMDLPMPKLYITPQESPNAFATGRNPQHSALAFTAGILQLMTDAELEGVVAHELGHVLHRDILISSVAATLAAAITAVARMTLWAGARARHRGAHAIGAIAMLILAPVAAMLIQMAVSRTREYDADAASAKYTGNPQQLIGALRKLETWSQRIPMKANPATQHMFIIQPFAGKSMMRLFSTHPRTEDRIARLEAMR